MELKYYTNTLDGQVWINKEALKKRVDQILHWTIPKEYKKDFSELFDEFMNECQYKD